MSYDAEYSAAFQSWLDSICTAYRGELPSGVTPTGAYITYRGYIGRFATPFIQPLQIYTPKNSDVSNILQVVDAIDDAVGEGGVLLNKENVNIWVKKGDPFYQDTDDEKENVKSGYLNLEITIYQKEN